MKRLLPVAAALMISLNLYPGEQKIVCDEDTGICRIEETDEKIPAAAEAAAGRDAAPGSRKLVGLTGKEDLIAFLRGDGAGAPEESTGFWGMILLALLGGLMLNLTPCVLPMLPVNLAIIGADGGAAGFRRGLLYGCGIAVAYGVLGVLAAFAGMNFGALNSSPVFNFVIAGIFILLSLAMAGVFDLDLSGRRIDPAKLGFGKDLTALFMGGISALLAGACVAPVVISVLIFAAGTVRFGNWYGCLAPFALGVGMGLPWPLAGAGLSILPKPGRYMQTLKYIFAAVIFAAGVYYTVLGIRLLPTDDPFDGPDGFAALKAAESESARSGRPILIKFTASWCKNCHAMEKGVLRDPEVVDLIRREFIMVTFPAEDPGEPRVKALLDRYGIPGLPAFVIVPGGKTGSR